MFKRCFNGDVGKVFRRLRPSFEDIVPDIGVMFHRIHLTWE